MYYVTGPGEFNGWLGCGEGGGRRKEGGREGEGEGGREGGRERESLHEVCGKVNRSDCITTTMHSVRDTWQV